MDDAHSWLIYGYSDVETGPFALNYITFDEALDAAVAAFPLAHILYIGKRCTDNTSLPCIGQTVIPVHID